MSKLTPLQTKVAGQILESIACGDFPPGSHIKEIELAQHFGVSRSPIRGALFYLAGQQILTAEKHCGFTVATACSEALQNTLAGLRVAEDDLYRLIIDDHLNQTLPGQINESDLLRRYQCSKSILRRCLQRLTEEGIIQRKHGHGWVMMPTLASAEQRLESYRFSMLPEPAALMEPGFCVVPEQLRQCRDNQLALLNGVPDSQHFIESNARFHELLAAWSGNRFILHSIQQQNRLRRLTETHTINNLRRVKVSCQEHLAILDALAEGDNQQASALLYRHLQVASQLGVARRKS